MPNFENVKVSILIVEIESSSSVATSLDRTSSYNSDTSSDESVGTSTKVPVPHNDRIFIMPVARASTSTSFNGLTIPIVVLLDPKFPRTTYAEDIATDLTTRELPDPNILQGRLITLAPRKNSQRPKHVSLETLSSRTIQWGRIAYPCL